MSGYCKKCNNSLQNEKILEFEEHIYRNDATSHVNKFYSHRDYTPLGEFPACIRQASRKIGTSSDP
jgi:hypothetical protein